MRLTVKKIVDTIKKETGIDDVGLDKSSYSDGGAYCWTGKAASMFIESSTNYTRLNNPNIKLETFVKEFKKKIADLEDERGEKIESIINAVDWEI
jgi:formiminotetrahydrofolate cyclodeaminase